ncbi:MAG: hypothetical protein ACOC7K_00355 [bacterium]
MDESQVVATVPAKTSLLVTRVRGDWIGVTVRRNRKDRRGWILAAHVTPDVERNPKARRRIKRKAKPAKFALDTIHNEVDQDIHYRFRWGDRGQWKSCTVSSGGAVWHSYEYENEDENRSPSPYVEFDSDYTSDAKWKKYAVEAFAAPAQLVECGMPYCFVETIEGQRIDLHRGNPTTNSEVAAEAPAVRELPVPEEPAPSAVVTRRGR